MMAAQGKLVVISAPSGAGKTTIARAILASHASLSFSISATTRAKRGNERDGVDYFFLTREEFLRRRDAGEFVESEEIYGNLYGTLKSEIDRALAAGRHLMFDVDVKGGLSLQRRYPDALLIFIRPPSLEVLKRRLLDRGTEDEATVDRRMERVAMEMERGLSFTHQVVNDELVRATAEVDALVTEYLNN
jgi:guanylate kinase